MKITDIKYVKFKDYIVDNQQNTNLFITFKEVVEILNNYNIKYAITGSLGLILHTKKFYRNIKDIDLITQEPLSIYEINLLIKENFIYSKTEFYTTLFNKNNFTIEFHSSRFYNKYNFDLSDSTLLNFEGNMVQVLNTKKILSNKKNLYNREKDADDIIFYGDKP